MVKDNQFKPTFNNQPFIPQTETRIFLGGRPIDQQVEQISFRVINRQQHYQSARVQEINPGYGPCLGCGEWGYDGWGKRFCLDIELHGGGLLNSGILRGFAGQYVCDTRDAAQAADDILNGRGRWSDVGCSVGDRQKLSNKIHEYIRRHQDGKEIDAKVSNLTY